MIPQPEYKVTTQILWEATIFFALADTLFILILSRRIKPDMFRRMKSILRITSALFWFIVWMLMCIYFWEPVYHYVFPGWSRWLIPPVYGVGFGLIAWFFWWLSFRIPGRPLLNFIILGGLLGMITHIWGITRGLLDKPPMLHGVSPVAASVMPVFEFIFYWCLILTVSSFIFRFFNRKKS